MTDVLIMKYCGALQIQDKQKKKRAIENLSKFLHEHDSELEVTEKIQIYKNILRCFNDKAEACREFAVKIITDITSFLHQEDDYLIYLMPALLQRLGGQERIESSEEVRLLKVSLLHCVINKYRPTLLSSYVNDIIQILVNTLVDPYPKIKKESCECSADLAETIPRHFYTYSQSLIVPILQSVTHQHYRIRIVAITAIGKVVRYGNNKSVDTVIGPLAERLFDQIQAVRQAVVQVIGIWLVQLPDRYSYFHRLLPLILTSLTDEIPDLKTEALKLWDEVGKVYMQENENEFKDQVDFLIDDPVHYPPFETRPNIGCRTLVNRHLCKIVPALVRELDDWLMDIRLKASQLLYSLILNAEVYITLHLEKILDGMYRASNDEDVRVVNNVEKAAELIGYFVPPDTYCKLVLPTMEDSATAGQLRVFAAILKGSDRSTLKEKLTDIGNFLKSAEICWSKETAYQIQLLSCCSNLMVVCEQDCKMIGYQLFVVIISVLGLATEEFVTKEALGCFHMLQSVETCTSLQNLFEKYLQPVLQEFQVSADSWSLCSPERFIFEALLIYAGSAIRLHLQIISEILVTCLKPEKDPEVRLKMFIILSSNVVATEELKCAHDSGPFLIKLVKVVLKRLDDVSDDVRVAAVATLVKLFKPLPADYCMEISFGHLDALFSTMLIHLDDPDLGFQHTMLDALKEIGEVNPKILLEKVGICTVKFCNAEGCRELTGYIERLLDN
ncbi:dynein assembly factor 5, axonemal isoform X2 [Zootermopsis nevadensis]|uniref:dynein assembly factor 5, axonemal isoform X2 n=1 Tax=Zootermopsis nevadensis TaxID=136037 RepID=UPI000B8E7233|nr:dynein assembly factor 5, axonemal isoform X2 [Zootermopsis nevadensis]